MGRSWLVWQGGYARAKLCVVALDDLIGDIYVARGVPDYRSGIAAAFQHSRVAMLFGEFLQVGENLLRDLLKDLLRFGVRV